MKNKAFKKFHSHKLFGSFLLVSLLIFTGCNADWRGGSETTTKETTADKQIQQAPVVVDGVRTSYADIVQKTTPAVVQITAVNTSGKTRKVEGVPKSLEDFFQMPNQPNQPNQQQPRPRRGFGSGVIVNADGTILTNHHVIDEADNIMVETSDDKSYKAKIVGSDPLSDLAVLKIEGEDFPSLKLGDSDQVRIGDIVLAIGNPLGIGQTVTSGIISAKGRRTGLSDGSRNNFEDFLQTDAPINQGNSGGALVNVNGELIGINSQILSQSGGSIGIGFAIPSNMAQSVMEQLLESGKVRRGMLGVNIQDINSDLAKVLELEDVSGVIVSNVMAGSAAEKAGIKRGDIITKIDGETVEDPNYLRNKVAASKPDSEITLTVVRDKKEQNVKVTLGEFKVEGAKPTEEKDSSGETKETEQNGKLGLSLQPLAPELKTKLNIPGEIFGVIVTEVEPGSPADEKGINKGDVIQEINKQKVTSLEEVRTALAKSGNGPALFVILRGGQSSYVTITPKN